ncbi:hypothetical protein [Actinospica robiniae]|uniref:hypothetical protein n=1 Tax=Actinospica robiniae TaxID=304901 RepID=UPI0012F7CACE|nr:hypothetical protein [Actinospica robiniae]
MVAKGEGRLDEALELLDQLIGRLHYAAQARSPQLLHIVARASGLRAITLDQVGGRQAEVVAAADAALAALEALGTGSAEVDQQVPPMLVLRVSAAESSSMGEADLIRLLEDCVGRIRRLPADSRRAAIWLLWDKKLMIKHIDQGCVTDAARVARRVIDGLPALGAAPELDFVAVHAGRDLARAAALKLADAGERELAAELAERCADLVGDASATSFDPSQSLTIAKGFYVTGMKFLGLTGTSLKLLAVALAQVRAANAFESQDPKVRLMAVGSLNAYAWELACRNGIGDKKAALPMAQEAVERARALVGEASSEPDMTLHVTLVEALETLATIHAQLGDTAIALEIGREAQSVACQLADIEGATGAESLERTNTLVELIEQGALAGITDRA